ncbi:hypothetical protein U1Q18_048966, partial [Sarracenia purpurea var. burkii]
LFTGGKAQAAKLPPAALHPQLFLSAVLAAQDRTTLSLSLFFLLSAAHKKEIATAVVSNSLIGEQKILKINYKSSVDIGEEATAAYKKKRKATAPPLLATK